MVIRGSAIGMALVFGLAAALTPQTAAAVLFVNTTSAAASDATKCTLRAAIKAINLGTAQGGCPAGSPTDYIFFEVPEGSTFTFSTPDVAGGPSALPNIGAGRDITIGNVDGVHVTLARDTNQPCHPDSTADPGEVTFFYVNSNAVLTLANTTLRNGCAGGGGGVPYAGGAIFNTGTVDLIHVRVTGNQAGASGGAIHNRGTLIVEDSRIDSNFAPRGAAIANVGGDVYAYRSLIDTNIAIADPLTGNGGTGFAIWNVKGGAGPTPGNVYFENTTVSSTLTLSTDVGSTIYSLDSMLTTVATTVADNAGYGVELGNGASWKHASTLLSNNQRGNCFFAAADPLVEEFTVGVSSDASCGAKGPGISDVDAQLGGLADNGGPWPSRLPAATSPVRDASSCLKPNNSLLNSDARAKPRPDGARCDAGAVEIIITDRIFLEGFDSLATSD